MDDMLADFSADHQQARAHLDHMAKEMAAKRAGKSAPAPAAQIAISTTVKPASVVAAAENKAQGNQVSPTKKTGKH